MDINLVVCDLYNGFIPFNNHEFMIDDVATLWHLYVSWNWIFQRMYHVNMVTKDDTAPKPFCIASLTMLCIFIFLYSQVLYMLVC